MVTISIKMYFKHYIINLLQMQKRFSWHEKWIFLESFGSMVSCFCYYPLTPKPEDNLKLVKEEQINQWFCSDVLMQGEYPIICILFEKNSVDLDITAEDRQILKEYTCDFVSFSYYSSSVVTTEEAEKLQGI